MDKTVVKVINAEEWVQLLERWMCEKLLRAAHQCPLEPFIPIVRAKNELEVDEEGYIKAKHLTQGYFVWPFRHPVGPDEKVVIAVEEWDGQETRLERVTYTNLQELLDSGWRLAVQSEPSICEGCGP